MNEETPEDERKKLELATKMTKNIFKSGSNPITDAFIQVLEEHPDVEILSRGENKVNWRFKIDSDIFRERIGHFESYDHLLKFDQRKRQELEKEYERVFIIQAKDKLGTFGVVKAVISETKKNKKDKKDGN